MKALIIHDEEMFRFAFKNIARDVSNLKSTIELDYGEELHSLSPNDYMDITLVIVKSSCLRNDEDRCWDIIAHICQFGTAIVIGNPAPEKHKISNAVVINDNITVSQMTYILKKTAPADNTPVSRTKLDPTVTLGPAKIEDSNKNHKLDLPYFSSRKLEILELISRGLNNKGIAEELNIAEGTIKAHIHLIMKVTKTTNRTQLALLYNNYVRNSTYIETGIV